MSEPFEPARPFGAGDARATMSAFVPILILGLALLAWFAFQATQLRMERDAMQATFAAQEKPMGDAKKLRDSLDVIAKGTAQLAESGNPGARLLVDELARRGVNLQAKTPAAPAAPTGPAK